MKVDFGCQIGGRIVDCAWTVSFNPVYDQEEESERERGREGGVDVGLCLVHVSSLSFAVMTLFCKLSKMPQIPD